MTTSAIKKSPQPDMAMAILPTACRFEVEDMQSRTSVVCGSAVCSMIQFARSFGAGSKVNDFLKYDQAETRSHAGGTTAQHLRQE